MDLMTNGLYKKEPEPAGFKASWRAKDSKGLLVELDNLRFGDEDYFPATLGDGKIKVAIEGVRRIDIEKKDSSYIARITHKDGLELNVSIKDDLLLSGCTKLGEYSVPMIKISEIAAFSAPHA